MYSQYEWQSELHVCSSRNACIETQEVSIILVYWTPVYRHICQQLLYIHICRLIHSTNLQLANIFTKLYLFNISPVAVDGRIIVAEGGTGCRNWQNTWAGRQVWSIMAHMPNKRRGTKYWLWIYYSGVSMQKFSFRRTGLRKLTGPVLGRFILQCHFFGRLWNLS